ncbi:hypothetical protein PLESTB_000774300 [Pleodorina starrii]|uniref:AB hydrolase-1 domain-containing protein n=1 Tax=Pleodorina starrii TaxID=330485 RepID=A0A9W6BK13_9CHLO|nr:hypothetical protein PLESTM_000431000 [Pleodorina starrii]GLC53666.1 hypothetical protein PLESTB_000774300 [Pleodorina starrii]GLC70181.1 hypothetical protein PLESTF_000934900 [Pleodorina starrii]
MASPVLRASSTSATIRMQLRKYAVKYAQPGRKARLHCAAGLLTAAAPKAAAGPEVLSQNFLRSVSYDELDVHTPIAYELYQGPLARWAHSNGQQPSQHQAPPTAVMVHGILGNRKNMASFAKMIVEGFPSWQVLMVDLRCHGESASLPTRSDGPHDVDSAGGDVLELLRRLRLFPRVLIGHSFGGKVVMSMVKQFPQRLPRPVQVWVLDSLPGQVRAGGGPEGGDHPGALIDFLRSIPMPVAGRNEVIDAVVRAGFSLNVARWVVTNLRPTRAGAAYGSGPLTWGFDLDGIADMYSSYESTALWDVVQRPPEGLSLDFVKAERSTFRWGGSDEAAITGAGHRVHLLPNSGHWVHADNPLGLYDILAPSFGGSSDLKQRRSAAVRT